MPSARGSSIQSSAHGNRDPPDRVTVAARRELELDAARAYVAEHGWPDDLHDDSVPDELLIPLLRLRGECFPDELFSDQAMGIAFMVHASLPAIESEAKVEAHAQEKRGPLPFRG
jgi:hypothetical protein